MEHWDADYLGKDLEPPLVVQAQGAGDGATDGSTRRKIVEQREQLRGAVLKVALSRHPDQRQRAEMAWRNRDKLVTSWL